MVFLLVGAGDALLFKMQAVTVVHIAFLGVIQCFHAIRKFRPDTSIAVAECRKPLIPWPCLPIYRITCLVGRGTGGIETTAGNRTTLTYS